ncbi:MAG: hypothetical protein GX776_06400, partial [Oxalobacter sp.]|nr:hypothetical protein [Oxalobacter sp.]
MCQNAGRTARMAWLFATAMMVMGVVAFIHGCAQVDAPDSSMIEPGFGQGRLSAAFCEKEK